MIPTLRRALAAAFFSSLAASCAPVQSYSPLDDPAYRKRPEIQGSLFPSDTAQVSNEAIAQILEGRIALPQKTNLAVYRIGQEGWGNPGAEAEYISFLAAKVKANPRVVGVTSIPVLLLPDKVTIPALREASARLQCELLLVYEVRMDTRYRARAFAADKAKVYASLEAFLFHVRTGIIPFTTVVDQEYADVDRDAGDQWLTLREKARNEAFTAALRKLGEEIVAFLDTIKG